jgi:hypothetical protein
MWDDPRVKAAKVIETAFCGGEKNDAKTPHRQWQPLSLEPLMINWPEEHREARRRATAVSWSSAGKTAGANSTVQGLSPEAGCGSVVRGQWK